MKLTGTRIITAVIAAIAIAAIFRYSGGGNKPSFELTQVEKRNIIQTVTETGNVTPTRSVDLAFLTGGKIARVYAGVGDNVSAGQALAALDSSQLQAQLNKAKANLQTQNSALSAANIGLSNYYADIQNTLSGAYTNANNAVRIQLAGLFSNAETNPQLTFTSNNSNDENSAEAQRLALSGLLSGWLVQINGLDQNTATGTLENALVQADANLIAVRKLLDTLQDAVINTTNQSSSTVNSYLSSINSARTVINTSQGNADALSQEIASQKATIMSNQNSIMSYAADVENLKVQISETVIYSPINGVVTAQNAKVGEVAVPNAAVTSVISSNQYEIDSFVPEVDIARVKAGDKAQVTLDAYGNGVVFEAVVTSIDPSETMIEGVATYKTKLQFLKNDDRIKPGMTANIDVVSGEHDNVIAVPARAVINSATSSTVVIYDARTNSTFSRDVTVGLKGENGYAEIVSGLNEGETVVIPKLSP